MQWERVVVMFSCLGILYMQTFKKLPIRTPKTNVGKNAISHINFHYELGEPSDLKYVAVAVVVFFH